MAAIIRLLHGGDFSVKLSVAETLELLGNANGDAFVQLPSDDEPVHVRPSSVIAVIEDPKKKTAGFRVGA